MTQKTIQDDFQKLEKIINKLEGQQVGLEESLTLFEEGSKIIKNCHGQLKKAKNKFEEIKGDLESEINKE